MVSPGGHPQNSAKFQPRYTEGMKIQAIPSTLLGENAYVVHSEGASDALVIDPGYGTAGPIHDYLARHQLEVANVLLTHGHPDHVWDCGQFTAPVWIPGPDRYRLEDPLAYVPFRQGWGPEPFQAPSDLRQLTSQTQMLATAVPILMIPAPGHTEGSAVLLSQIDAGTTVELNVPGLPTGKHELAQNQPIAWPGDVIFAGSVGRTDLPGGDETQMRHTLRTLSNALDPATWLLPGHGPATSWEIEKRTNPYVRRAQEVG